MVAFGEKKNTQKNENSRSVLLSLLYSTAKATHIFSAKNFSVFAYHSM